MVISPSFKPGQDKISFTLSLFGTLLLCIDLYAQCFNGAEFLVHPEETAGPQTSADVAMNNSGNAVVTWSSADGSDFGVYARRLYSVGGNMGIIPVNQQMTNRQIDAKVAMDINGNFVIVWADWNDFDIHARLFDNTGAPLGNEFIVNTYVTDQQLQPEVAMEENGDFVIVWTSDGQDGEEAGVFGKRFMANGTPISMEFQVNTYFNRIQDNPAIAMDDDGDFVVVWQSLNQDGPDFSIFAQRFSNTGLKIGGEFPVHTVIAGSQSSPDVAMGADGGFIVSFTSNDGNQEGIFTRVFSEAGSPSGPEFQVNTTITNIQTQSAVEADPIGNFLVCWQSLDQDGDLTGIYARYFNTIGQPITPEFKVNTYTTNFQNFCRVAMAADGGALIVWNSIGQDGSGDGVYRQLLNGLPLPTGVVTHNTSCAPPYTASIDLTIHGGLLPHSIIWSNGARTEDISGLAPGTYTVTIVDEMTCAVTYSVNVTCANNIPTLNQWGMLVLASLLGILGVNYIRRVNPIENEKIISN